MLVDAADMPVPREFQERLRPGAARAWYLLQWLQNGLPAKWLSKPLLIQVGLTLFLHDRPSDAAGALLGWARSQRMRNNDRLLKIANVARRTRKLSQ